jgi:ParB-like chromosome segregation protein Spo0J
MRCLSICAELGALVLLSPAAGTPMGLGSRAAALMLAENVKRVDLNPMDEARAYHKRMQRFGWSLGKCAEKANVSEDKVRRRIRLLGLTTEVQGLVAGGQLPIGYAEAMADLDANRQRIAMRCFQQARRPTLAEFRDLAGKLYAQQASDSLFDLAALMAHNGEQAAAPDHQGAGLPVHPRLPQMRGALSVGQALEAYLRDLTASEDQEQKQAALVVATVYDGLLRSNVARRPRG